MGKSEALRNESRSKNERYTASGVQNLVKEGMCGLKNFLVDLVNGDDNPDTCCYNDVNLDDLTCSTVPCTSATPPLPYGNKYWYNCNGEPMAPRYGYITQTLPLPRPPQQFIQSSTVCPNKQKCRRVCCPVDPAPPCQHSGPDINQCLRRNQSTPSVPNWQGNCRSQPPASTFAFDRGDSQVNQFRCCALGKAEAELDARTCLPQRPSPRPADDGQLDLTDDADLDRLQPGVGRNCIHSQYRSGDDRPRDACELCSQSRSKDPDPYYQNLPQPCNCPPPAQTPCCCMQPPFPPWWYNPYFQIPPYCPPPPKKKEPDWKRLFPLFLGKENENSCSEDCSDPCKNAGERPYQSPLSSCRSCKVKVESNTKCDDHGSIWKHYGPVLDHLRNRKFHHVTADVNILAEGKIFPAHKIVLMTYSKYFRNLFLDNICQVEVDLCPLGVDKEGCQAVIEWMYTGKLTISMCNIVVIWNASTILKISALERKCKRYLRDLVKCQGQQGVCSLLSTLGLREDFLDATDINVCCPSNTCQNVCQMELDFQEIKRTGLFLRFPKERLIAMLANDDINITSEKEIFDVAAAWLFFQWPARKDCIPLVMRCVRFPLMTRCEVLQCLSDARYQCLWSDPTTISLAIIAYMYLNAKKKGNADAGRLGVKLRSCITT